MNGDAWPCRIEPRRVRSVVLLLSFAAVVACGGDDETADRQQFVDEAVKSNRNDQSSPLSDAQAECLAGAVVDAIGVDQLNDGKISVDEFATFQWMVGGLGVEMSLATVEELAERLANCDLPLMADEFLDPQVAPGSDVEYSPGAYACLTDGFNARNSEFFANLIARDQDATQKIVIDAYSECPGAITEIVLAGFEDRGTEVTPEAKLCIADSVEQVGPDFAPMFFSAADDQAAKQELAERVLTPCAHLLGS